MNLQTTPSLKDPASPHEGHHNYVLSGLVNMYGKCRSIKNVQKASEKMSEHSLVSWTAIIAGYEQNDYGNEALSLFPSNEGGRH